MSCHECHKKKKGPAEELSPPILSDGKTLEGEPYFDPDQRMAFVDGKTVDEDPERVARDNSGRAAYVDGKTMDADPVGVTDKDFPPVAYTDGQSLDDPPDPVHNPIPHARWTDGTLLDGCAFETLEVESEEIKVKDKDTLLDGVYYRESGYGYLVKVTTCNFPGTWRLQWAVDGGSWTTIPEGGVQLSDENKNDVIADDPADNSNRYESDDEFDRLYMQWIAIPDYAKDVAIRFEFEHEDGDIVHSGAVELRIDYPIFVEIHTDPIAGHEDTETAPESTTTDDDGRITAATWDFKNYLVIKSANDQDLSQLTPRSNGQDIDGSFTDTIDGVQYLFVPAPHYGSLTSIGLYFDNLDALSNEVNVEAAMPYTPPQDGWNVETKVNTAILLEGEDGWNVETEVNSASERLDEGADGWNVETNIKTKT